MRLFALSLVGLTALLASCTGQTQDDPRATVTVTATATATVTASASDAEQKDEPSPSIGPAQLGAEIETSFGTVQALELDPDVTSDVNSRDAIGDERWAALLVRTCVAEDYTDERVRLSWGPWSMSDRTDGVYGTLADTTGPSYPQPSYPQLGNTTTRPGTCVRGWIVFSVSGGSKLVEAIYEPRGSEGPLVWSL